MDLDKKPSTVPLSSQQYCSPLISSRLYYTSLRSSPLYSTNRSEAHCTPRNLFDKQLIVLHPTDQNPLYSNSDQQSPLHTPVTSSPLYNVQHHGSEAHGAARCTYSGRQTMLYSTPRISSSLVHPPYFARDAFY
jgi:hypothetical protein